MNTRMLSLVAVLFIVLVPPANVAKHLTDSVPNWQLIAGTQYKQVCCKSYSEIKKKLAMKKV